MLRKRWIIVLALTGVLTAMITGGVLFAQETDTDEGTASQSFAARVAVILGLEEAPVQAALQQVRQEIREESIQNRLDRLVEKGRITQEQTDELKKWYDSRPDGLAGPLRGHRHGKFHFGHNR